MALTGINSGFEFKYEAVRWHGPEGYIIVVPRGDTEAVKTAKILNGYFKRLYDTELRITNDSSNEAAKEILIGATNRKESDHSLKESELSVTVKGEKLVFDGGHYVTVNSAVERFIRLSPEKGIAAVFSDDTDFVSEKTGGYIYVWGDEFEGDEINLSKWCFEKRMGGTENMMVQYTDDVITIGDGHATLRAIAYNDPENPQTEYKVPYSLCTLSTMNFDYGYAEIRAKVPYETGVWPSFWATTACNISGRQNMQLHAEIDMFENFGSKELIVANVHKWYDEMDYNKIYNTGSSKRGEMENSPSGIPREKPSASTGSTSVTPPIFRTGRRWIPWRRNWSDRGTTSSAFIITTPRCLTGTRRTALRWIRSRWRSWTTFSTG